MRTDELLNAEITLKTNFAWFKLSAMLVYNRYCCRAGDDALLRINSSVLFLSTMARKVVLLILNFDRVTS